MPGTDLPRCARLSTTVLLAALACLAGVLPAAATARDYWTNPAAQAATWVAAHPDDPRTEVIRTGVAEVPSATWFVGGSASATESAVRDVAARAETAGRVPLLALYNIPGRDCGQYSAGGAADWSAYRSWIDGVARGLAGADADVVLEPDALPSVVSCPGADREALTGALAEAVATLHAAAPASRIYLDAGHSNWVPASRMAQLLREAGISEGAAGISTNVSNYYTTASEVAYAQDVLRLVGDSRLGALVDTSRNGNGPQGTWCDPVGAATGQRPTRATGLDRIDAFAWVKVPGEADGCAAAPGTFMPQVAYDQALAGGTEPAVVAPTPSTSPSPTPEPSLSPAASSSPTQAPSATSTASPAAGCQVVGTVVSSWSTAYHVEMTVRAESAIEDWSVVWDLPAGHRVDQLWNGVADARTDRVVVSAASWNSELQAGDEATFGAIVTAPGGSNGAPVVTCAPR